MIERGRGLKTLSLTPGGQQFLAIARRWEELDQETKLIRSRTKNMTLSIGAVDSIQAYILPPVYRTLNEHIANMDVRIRTQQSSELYLLLERGEIDIAFANQEQPMPNMLIKPFYTEQMVVVSKGALPAAYRTVNDQSLPTSDELYFEWSPTYRVWHDRWIGEREHPTIRVDTAQLLLTFLDTPAKWAVVPMSMARKFEAAGEFTIYELEDPPPERVCYLIRPRYPRASAVESLQIFESCVSSALG
jgi:DNA-binding transcriptional LysR family regulator